MSNKMDFTPYKDDEVDDLFLSKLPINLGGSAFRINNMLNISDRTSFSALQIKIKKKWFFLHDGKRAFFFEGRKTAKNVLKMLEKSLVSI